MQYEHGDSNARSLRGNLSCCHWLAAPGNAGNGASPSRSCEALLQQLQGRDELLAEMFADIDTKFAKIPEREEISRLASELTEAREVLREVREKCKDTGPAPEVFSHADSPATETRVLVQQCRVDLNVHARKMDAIVKGNSELRKQVRKEVSEVSKVRFLNSVIINIGRTTGPVDFGPVSLLS